MKVLLFSTLFPNAADPGKGLFVEQRLRKVLETGRVDAKVVAPVPWFPFTHARFGEYARHAAAPRREVRNGVDVLHPRYPLLPKIGMTLAPLSLALATLPTLRALRERGFDFDVIDAHYYYPDGVAAALLGKWLRKPVVITARGTDINLIPQHALPRRMIRWAAEQSAASVAVCKALKDEMIKLGIEPARVNVLRNGVDLERFFPEDREAARRKLGLAGPLLLSVGYLIERKGHHLIIEALASLPEWRLAIAGRGEMEGALRALAAQKGVADRVSFVGQVAQNDLKTYYSAADALVLASSREGWANVLLEAMACGTPVVATPVWGTPEVVCVPEAGVLTRERSAAAIADGVRQLAQHYPAREATRRYAEQFGWDETTRGQLQLFERVAAA